MMSLDIFLMVTLSINIEMRMTISLAEHLVIIQSHMAKNIWRDRCFTFAHEMICYGFQAETKFRECTELPDHKVVLSK